jgi:hypothetical protein
MASYMEIVICPVCWHRVPKRTNGTIGSHYDIAKRHCPGIGQPAGKVVSAYTKH